MKPEEVPVELVSEAVDVWRMQDGSVLDGMTNVLAVVLPAHEALVRERITSALGAAVVEAEQAAAAGTEALSARLLFNLRYRRSPTLVHGDARTIASIAYNHVIDRIEAAT